MVDQHTYKFDVEITSSACMGAITRTLDKARCDHDGVSSDFTVNFETEEVLVVATIPYEDVLAMIKKTGKEVRHNPFTPEFSVFYLGPVLGDSSKKHDYVGLNTADLVQQPRM
ncbi:hypothetical protein B0H14DRAFT_2508089 [Mycena olivaceomarginata]|nr:hypothetical protein B0H14DRAFT_2508089 [Mycena olivaceomarginata]